MPNAKRWEYGVQYPNGYIDACGIGKEGKRIAKMRMSKGDKLKRRFVGRWKDE